MLIAQLTDLHIAAPGMKVYDTVDTSACLRAALHRLNTMTPRPDLVLVTGDLVDHGTQQEYEHLKALLSALEIPLYLTIGNHDDRDAFWATFGDLDYLRNTGPGVSYAIETPALRLLALDTGVTGRPHGELSPELLGWLSTQLAQNPDQASLLFMHHPPFDSGIWWMDAIGLHGANELEQIVRAHPQVRRVVCGHIHRPIVTQWAGIVCSVAPSTAHHVGLDLAGDAFLELSIEPPAIHLHQVGQNGDIVTHTCYVEAITERFLPGDHIQGQLADYRLKFQQLHALKNGRSAR